MSHVHTYNKAVLKGALLLIAAFMLVEVAGGLLTNSLALLSDAGHMFSDALALGLSLAPSTGASAPTRCATPTVSAAAKSSPPP